MSIDYFYISNSLAETMLIFLIAFIFTYSLSLSLLFFSKCVTPFCVFLWLGNLVFSLVTNLTISTKRCVYSLKKYLFSWFADRIIDMDYFFLQFISYSLSIAWGQIVIITKQWLKIPMDVCCRKFREVR